MANTTLFAVGIGLLAWLLGTFVSGDVLLRNTGYAIVFIGFLSLVQWAVQTGRSKPEYVRFCGLFTGIVGAVLVFVWAVWWFIFEY